jgi:hypothetical protein
MAVEADGEGEARTGGGRSKGKAKRRGGKDKAFTANVAAMGGVAVGDRVLRERRHAPNAYCEPNTDDEDDQVGKEEIWIPPFFLSFALLRLRLLFCILPYFYLGVSISLGEGSTIDSSKT